MTTTATKPRAPKAIAVSKLIGGKLVTTLAPSEIQRLQKAHGLCFDLVGVEGWKAEAVAASDALATLLAKVKG